ncbi:MAG TPA: insulinase family protein [Armatimonadota bacterium]|nr:insulinase family protein [Armatimonadota bacterium]HOQ28076.1 insulinase family protein [Armatimonadota bacterium]HPO72273.1 insulinase family protein [Armatimonadota bacterium]
MTFRFLRLFMLVCGAALAHLAMAPVPAHAGRILDPATITQTTLPNGLRVVIKEAPSIPLVALNVWVRAGSSDETEENNGVSHFLEHLMFKGSKKRGPGEFDLEIEGLGGLANATTMEDATQYYVVVAQQYALQALEALGDMISNPTFPEEELRRERQIILNEVAQAAEDPQRILSEWINRLSFQSHPYRLPIAGTPQSIRQITREKIQAFYDKYYVAGNMTLVVVGAVKAAEVLPQIEAAFAGLRTGPVPARDYSMEPIPEKVRFSTLERPVSGASLVFGFRAPGMDAKDDVCAMDVLLYILGEQRAQSGRLNRELRQKQNLVSAIWSDYVTLRHPGIVTFWAETEPAKLEAARAAILEQIAQVRDTLVPDDEIQRAKMLLLGVYTMDNETYDGQAGTLGFYEAKDTYQFALEYEERIARVTAADIQRVARKYLGENSYCLAVLRPKQSEGGSIATGTETRSIDPPLEGEPAPAAESTRPEEAPTPTTEGTRPEGASAPAGAQPAGEGPQPPEGGDMQSGNQAASGATPSEAGGAE